MEALLTPVKTSTSITHGEDLLVPVHSSLKKDSETKLETLDDAVATLKSEPSIETLKRTLRWFESHFVKDDASNIKVSNSKSAQVLFVLVNVILPNYWSVLETGRNTSHTKVRDSLIRCLSSITGISTIANGLGLLLNKYQSQTQPEKDSQVQNVADLSSLLQKVLTKTAFAHDLWQDLFSFVSVPAKRLLFWKEAVSLLATGRILALAARADEVTRDSSPVLKEGSWLGNGAEYAKWLGSSIQYMIQQVDVSNEENWKAVTQMLSKALVLGYTNNIIEAVFSNVLAGKDRDLDVYRRTLENLTLNEQRSVLHSVLRITSRRIQSHDRDLSDGYRQDSWSKVSKGVAGLLFSLTTNNHTLTECLCEWLTSSSPGAASQGIKVHRAVIAVLARGEGYLKLVFDKALSIFGDKLYIKHTPLLQQEVTTQILLIVAGYIHRMNPIYLSQQSRSSTYLNAISNRLSASSERATLLGMLVGTAVSELVDVEGKRMKFSAEETDTAEGKQYRSLTAIQDTVGSLEDLISEAAPTKTLSAANNQILNLDNRNNQSLSKTGTASRIVAIEEVDVDSESEDEDIVMYEKPDSDASDEDEDPTLVQRDRPTAPVYIRDLIAGLRDTENFDRHKLALSHASDLIRRKASFGSEVSEHIEELATLLIGLGDKYNMDDFQQMRLRGMIAVLVAQPLRMAQWFSRTFFNGDYSVGQRASVLTTLGLGAREMAGLQKEDSSLTGADTSSRNPFPSKLLPDKLHKIYAIEAKPVDDISERLEKSMIKPMALEAAEQLSGPSALKVRTFSSRMAVEKKREKPLANSLAKTAAEGFIFPLTGLWRMHAQAYGDQTVHSSPFLLTLYLKTLSLILHAAGSSISSILQVTAEVWDLLLALRSHAGDLPVLEALLFALLTLLDINENNHRSIADEHGKELLETQEWVQTVFEKIGGGSEEGDRVRMLAAGVLTRTREVVEKHQRLLLGAMADYM